MSSIWTWLAAVWLLAGPWAVAQQPPPPAPPPLTVSVAPAARWPRATVHFEGIEVEAATQNFRQVRRDAEAATFGSAGDELELTIKAVAKGPAQRVQLRGGVRDYRGTELLPVTGELAVPADGAAEFPVRFRPRPEDPGPFYFTGTWQVADGALKGAWALAVGQANARRVVTDFEQVQYPEPGAALENSPAARHRGDYGLLVRLPAKALPPPPNTPPDRVVPQALQAVPLERELPGRPAKLSVWVKTAVPLGLALRLRDLPVEVRQANYSDRWQVGFVPVAAGDWQRVELPVPDYGRPLAERKAYGETNGVLDYPLTLEGLDLVGPPAASCCLDDVEVWTQAEPEQRFALRAINEKPVGLLYHQDRLSLAVVNASLWGEARLKYTAQLEDLTGRPWPLASAEVSVPLGAEYVQPVPLRDLPTGAYRFTGEVKLGEQVVARAAAGTQFLVYEPTGQPLPLRDLHALLGQRNRLLATLGFTRDLVLVPWHSVDGSPSVEPFPGYWTFEWLTPALQAERDAGIELVGVLGLTPLWADPSATWNKKMGAWYGSTTVLPSRPIYWEEYVRRTVERYPKLITTWVVWDRPDAQSFNATPEEFAEQMVAVAYQAAKAANPDVRLVSGAVTRENLDPYLIALAETGAARYLTGIGVLPSTAPLAPEDGFLDVVLARAQRVRRQEQIAAELWVLNLAWPTGTDPYRVSEFEQAVYVPRAYLLCRAQGIKQILVKADLTEAMPGRDTADLIYPEGPLRGIKPAALTVQAVRSRFEAATFRAEIPLNDRWPGLAQAQLYQRPDGKLLVAAWRREGQSTWSLPVPESIVDCFGNPVTPGAGTNGVTLTLRPDPQYLTFPAGEATALARALARRPVHYADAPESLWKQQLAFHLDVGDPGDEQAAQYQAPGSRLVGPLTSNYHNDYGPLVTDSGRHFMGEESFAVPVADYGDADLLLRRRLNYAVPDQLLKVYCNDQYVGQWFAFKRDRRYRWRDAEFIIPNRFFHRQPAARLRLAAQGNREATSYYYWAGPFTSRVAYASDLSHLVSTSGFGPGVNRDKNILGGPLRFFKQPGQTHAKGLGTNAAAKLTDSLVVLSLNQQFKRFRATVGIDAAANGQGSCRFRIGDGSRMIWDSGDLTYYSEPKEVDLDVSDAVILMLWTDDSGDGHQNDLGDWAAARLELK